MYEDIQKSKVQGLSQFISAIGVEGVSVAKCEKIMAQGYNSIDKILEITVEQMQQIEGFAEKSSIAITSSLKKKEPLIRELQALGVFLKADEINSGEGPLMGLKFCITGELSMNRGEFEKVIKKNGGIMVSSVSKNTSFLITNEIDGSSSKFVKAKALGVPIINEQELIKMIEG
jgi:DNA ligase (NAD+)